MQKSQTNPEKENPPPIQNLFVYGTLRVHKEIHPLLKGCQIIQTHVRIPGYRMYSCGAYPTVEPVSSGNFSILGDIVGVSQKTLEILDEYEDLSSGEYERVWDSKHVFWIYVKGKNPKKIFFPIDHGIWE